MIRHILADGREVQNIEGLVVPTTGATAAVYRIIAEHAKNHQEAVHNKEETKNATA